VKKGRKMNRKGKIGIVAAIATVLLIAAVGSASAVTVIDHCSFDANVEGEYYVLGQNLTCSGSEHGIKIKADNIVIDGYNETDGKYYWIDGSITNCDTFWSGVLDKDGHDNVVIKNLEIKNFCMGIWLKGDDSCSGEVLNENYTIENCIIHDNGIGTGTDMYTDGIKLHCVCDSTITKNEIYNQNGTGAGCEAGGDGIFLKGPKAWGNNITWNNIHNNRKGGIFTKMKPKNNTISYNHVWENGQAGAGEAGGIILRCKLCRYNLIAYNNASDNRGGGIFIGGPNNTVRDNNVNDNDWYGICLGRSDGSWYNIIENNTICGNKGIGGGTYTHSGIHIVEGAHDNKLYNNTICDNSQYDVYNKDSSTTGDWNTCSMCFNYNDTSATGCCLYKCSGTGPDLVVIDLHETWVVEGSSYNVTFTVKNIGGENATTVSNTSVRIVNNTGVEVHNQKYQTPALNAIQYPGNSSTWEIGPFGFTNAAAPHTITVCADIDDDVDEYGAGDEENNCSEDVFGAPDLVISLDCA